MSTTQTPTPDLDLDLATREELVAEVVRLRSLLRAPTPSGEMRELLGKGIEILELSALSMHLLRNAEILTVRELIQKTPQDLILGARGHKDPIRKILTEIEKGLRNLNPELRLGMKLI